MNIKFGICNELYENWPFEKVCKYVASVGYHGLEVAPFTLAENPLEVSSSRRAELRRMAADAGIEILGLHWLLVSPKGLHITTPDAAVRRKTTDFLKGLVDLCGDLGGKIMVFGSPKQRNLEDGQPYPAAWNNAKECFAAILDRLAARGVTLALEPLGPGEGNFLRTSHEAWHMVRELKHPNFKLHLDVKAMTSEGRPLPELIRQHIGETAHFHANDANRKGPGFGDVDFVPIMAALKESNYNGYVSVEVFDYTPDPETITAGSIANLKKAMAGGK